MQVNDFIGYIDTDSLFILLGKWLDYWNEREEFDAWEEDKQIDYIIQLSKKIEQYVNKQMFEVIQLEEFNSREKDFKINFKQEIVAPKALFVQKKKYGCWIRNEELNMVDKLAVKGLEIIKAETSEEVKIRLKDIMTMILKGYEDSEINKKIFQYVKELKKVSIEDLSINIGVNNIEKYLSTGKPIKGTPWNIKGVYAYRYLLDKFNLNDYYEDIHNGERIKIIYLKKNKFNLDAISYPGHFPKEILKEVDVDKEKMIDKFFKNKIKMLLEPCNKTDLIYNDNSLLDIFFN